MSGQEEEDVQESPSIKSRVGAAVGKALSSDAHMRGIPFFWGFAFACLLLGAIYIGAQLIIQGQQVYYQQFKATQPVSAPVSIPAPALGEIKHDTKSSPSASEDIQRTQKSIGTMADSLTDTAKNMGTITQNITDIKSTVAKTNNVVDEKMKTMQEEMQKMSSLIVQLKDTPQKAGTGIDPATLKKLEDMTKTIETAMATGKSTPTQDLEPLRKDMTNVKEGLKQLTEVVKTKVKNPDEVKVGVPNIGEEFPKK